MQITKHLKVSAIADGPDPSQVNPSDWNAAHVFTGGAMGGLLMRDTGDATYGASWLAAVAAQQVLISNGIGAAPSWSGSLTLAGPIVSLTGASSIGGNLSVGGTITNYTAISTYGPLQVQNPGTAAGTRTDLYVGNNANPSMLDIVTYNSNWVTSAVFDVANSTLFYQAGAGLTFVAAGAGAPIDLWTGGQRRVRIATSGELLVGAAATQLFSAIMSVQADLSVRAQILALQNLSSSVQTNQFQLFLNYQGGGAGTIQQTGLTSVSFGTSSDRRLKEDHGVAGDLSALRAVVVHDFAWIADGRIDRGVFAQEAAALFPRAIVPGTDERSPEGALVTPWMADYSKFVPDLIVGWQEHDARIAALEARG